MINDFLDFSQINNCKLRLNYERFSLWEIIKNVSKLIKFQAKIKGLNFTSENYIRDTRRDAFLKSDPNRIQQIILNLLGNALKFTETGLIKITLEISDKIDSYIIKVIDTGLGIKLEDQAKLFKLFSKADDNISRNINKSGVGLGLVISQSLVKILNNHREDAEIKIESEYKKGSTFSFPLLITNTNDLLDEGETCETLEYQPEEMQEKLSFLSRNFKKSSPLEKISRILVVDDDQINILVASNYLKGLNKFNFDVAFSGKEAIEKVQKQALSGIFYDVVLMDCNMPVMDGFEATKILNVMVDLGKIPKLSIIACTANASQSDFEICIQSGMCDIIIKPYSKNELILKLKKHLQNNRKEFF